MSEVQDLNSDGDSTAVVFEHLTRTGSKLFGDDGQVPCGLMFRRGNGQALLFSAAPIVAEMYRVLDAEQAREQASTLPASNASEMRVANDLIDLRHPSYFDVPASRGFASILSIPLTVSPEVRAVLNFYARPGAFFSSDRQRAASAFAEQAGNSLELGLQLAQYRDLATNMRSAMESRTSSDMAIGIIIAQNRCSQETASEILKRASNTRNIKVRDLADSMVMQASGGTPVTHFS